MNSTWECVITVQLYTKEQTWNLWLISAGWGIFQAIGCSVVLETSKNVGVDLDVFLDFRSQSMGCVCGDSNS